MVFGPIITVYDVVYGVCRRLFKCAWIAKVLK